VIDNESNEFPFVIELTSERPNYQQKFNMIQNKSQLRRIYRVVPCFTNQSVIDFFSYLRFITFDENMNILVNVNIL
jgi:hypothetical protein